MVSHVKTTPLLHVFPSTEKLFKSAADDFLHLVRHHVEKKGRCSVVLSGGNTPAVFFDLLASDPTYFKGIPWEKIKFFFGDERYVPSTDQESNYHMAYEHLFAKVPVVESNIFSIPTEYADPAEAARAYQQTICDALSLKKDEVPCFEIIFLGLGDNAHTASLMPCTDVVQDAIDSTHTQQWVRAVWVPELKMYRITLMPWVINQSQQIVFLVDGVVKAEAVKHILKDASNPLLYPAQLIQSTKGQVVWYLDEDAASLLS